MDRQYLAALGLVVYGGVLAVLYLVQGIGADMLSVLRLGPFVLIAVTMGYTGVWLLRHPDFREHADWVVAWTVGGGTTFMALAALVVLNHWVDVATTTPAARTILDTVTGGSLAGTVAGLYDAQSRQRYNALQIERDRVERFANKAESLNRYARALNESGHIDEVSALSVEVVQLLIESREAAFLLVDAATVQIVDSTMAAGDVLDQVAREVASYDAMETVRCPAETDCDLPEESGIPSVVAIPIPTGDGRTAVLLAVPDASDADGEEDIELLELLAAHMATALRDVDTRRLEPQEPSSD